MGKKLLFFFSIAAYAWAVAQDQTVQGTLVASSLPVRYAVVSVLNPSDSSTIRSVLTDASGSFLLTVPGEVYSEASLPLEFELAQNYPNPFQQSTHISYQIAKQTEAEIVIYDMLGREIKRFTMGLQRQGNYSLQWDGKDKIGKHVATGVYFYQLRTQQGTQVRKMVYGAGSSVQSGMIPPVPAMRKEIRSSVLSRNLHLFLKVENTDSTFPAIVPRFVDTTINQNALQLQVSSVISFPNTNTAIVYPESLKQTIRGFGGANILQWRPDMTTDQVRKAFGTDSGQIGFTILRLRIPYNLNEQSLSIQVPTAKLVQSMGGIVFASPWTPPAWMKTNNNIVGGALHETSYASYAAHLKQFADYMASKDVPLYAISIQNEPDIEVTYESCWWNAETMIRFLKENAPSIGVRIIAPESFHFRKSFSDSLLSNEEAAANLSIVGGHIYGGGIAEHPLAETMGKEIWMTEHLDTDTTWKAVLATGKEISDCLKAGWHAYVWWYIVRFYGPINEEGNVSKRGYVMSQFARFVRPGYQRVAVKDNVLYTNIDVTAFRQGAKLVIVAVNNRTTPKKHTFILWNGATGIFTPYVTSVTKNCERQQDIQYKNGSFTFDLEAQSIVTFVSQ